MNDSTAHRHWRLETDFHGIAWLYFDHEDSSTNVLSQEVLESLDHILEALEHQRPKGLIIVSAKKNGFIAGADVREFSALDTENTAIQLIRQGQVVIDRIAGLTFPTVSLIHGFCLGGGLELALACNYRIARNDADTRLGLPEVKLGIHPGFGGSVRLPALIGGLPAMELMLSGRSINSRQARRMGIVDEAVPERQMRATAEMYILDEPAMHTPGFLAGLTNLMTARKLAGPILHRKVEARAPAEHYPAPHALIDLWVEHFGNPFTMLPQEAASVARLISGTTAQNLVRVFLLQEQLKTLGRKTEQRVRHVHVVGAGIMGGDIASWCAVSGLTVTLQDREPKYIAPAIKRAYTLFKRRLKVSREVTAAMDRIMPDPTGSGVARADVVIEAIYEDREAKQALYRDLEPRMKADAFLATNTSSIPLEELADGLQRPDRLVGLHFFNPVAKMQLVEVVRSNKTNADVFAQAMSFTRQIDRLPLPVKSTPGFLVNRVLMPYLLEAVIIESEGVPAPVIDRAAKRFGMPMGPIELADTVGLDICLHVAEILSEHFDSEVPYRLRTLVAEGNLGRKSGQGFYRYKKGKPVRPAVKRSYEAPADLTERMIAPMLNETVACLHEGVVESPDHADAGMIYGTGFAPFRGGPMHYLKAEEFDTYREKLRRLEQQYGERFAPNEGWENRP